MSKVISFSLFLFLYISLAFPQTYTTTNGVSNPAGSCYCMTSPGVFSSAVWEDDNLRLFDFQRSNKDLSWDFEIYLGTEEDGGHGMAFVIQGEGPTAAGNGGAPLGYGGTSAIIPSVAIEIDTNPNSFDPTTEDHMAVHLQGNHTNPATGTGAVVLPNMEDGAYHSFSVVWHYDDVTPSNSTLTATLDGLYTLTYRFDPSFLFNSFNPIYVGFTSGVNSVATNDHKVSFGNPGDPGTCSDISLPVEFVSFDAAVTAGQSVQLEWMTASEVNNDYFKVMRSADGQIWESIALVDGVGNSQEMTSYQAQDVSPFEGKIFYQLKQVDFNGDFDFSEIVEIEMGFKQPISIKAYPNPASDHVFVQLAVEDLHQETRVGLFHITGRLVRSIPATQLNAHTQTLRLETEDLPSGLYFLKAENKWFKTVEQIMISR